MENNQLQIPELSLVLLIGSTSSGKSTFAKKHFLPTEIISSDYCRAMVSDSENDMDATQDAFDLLHYMVDKRLKRGKLTVVDATNLHHTSRQPLLKLAKKHHFLTVAIALDTPEKILKERHDERTDRNFKHHVIRNHVRSMRKAVRDIKKERYTQKYILSPEAAATATIERTPLYSNKKQEKGPFDIIGDIHGCFDELRTLLEKLNYQVNDVPLSQNYGFQVTHPEGRRAFFVGDFGDRGPNTPRVYRLVMSMVKTGVALAVPGNHDTKLLKHLNGKKTNTKHGFDLTLEQLKREPKDFLEELKIFLKSLISHNIVDDGKLVVAHAGLKESMHGRGSSGVRSFCLYGDVTGEVDDYGMPIRLNWAADYRGKAMVVYGHVAVLEAQWLNNTIDIDTGCVFGGKLTALRYPERELVQVPALRQYCEPTKPLGYFGQSDNAQHENDNLLNISDYIGRKSIATKYAHNITIKEGNTAAALEVMSRFAIDPKWLIHLPPTMSPTETSKLPDYLEYPTQAFEYYQKYDVEQVICEEKHMGSRAIVIVCKEGEVAQKRFGLTNPSMGVVYTRTGRSFFKDAAIEKAFLERVNKALTTSNFWERLKTDWVCLDCELMPWSAKAQSLIKQQYAAVGASGLHALSDAVDVLSKAKKNGLPIDALLTRYEEKHQNIQSYQAAYQAYCKPTDGLEGLVLAPFHILATEHEVHSNKNHEWHITEIATICAADSEFLLATPYRIVNVFDEASVKAATTWWEELTAKGGEGFVVKPLNYIQRGKRGIIQPAIKCRGREYLRIIYGPDYTMEKHLRRLKKRNLNRKRAMAMREFALGLEALDRFVGKEPLRRVHECVFGVLAMESEAVDPRL